MVALIWHGLFAARMRFTTTRTTLVAASLAWGILFLCWTSASATTGARMQAGPRTVIWAQLWDAIWLRPWLGFGWNQVGVAQVAVAADHPASRMVEHSHNILLDLALWNGVPIALVIVSLACLWIARAVRRTRTVEGAAALLMIGLFLAHSMVEFPLDYLYFLVPFSVALGIVSAEVEGTSRWTVNRIWGSIAIAAFVWIMGAAAADYWKVEQSFREMRFTVARIGGAMSSSTPPPIDTRFSQLNAFYQFALTPVESGIDARKLEWMKNVAHRYAFSSSLYRYGVAQGINGDIPGARITFLQLRNLHGEGPYAEAKAEIDGFFASQYPILNSLHLP